MDREIISFNKKGIPIAIYNLKIEKGVAYRGMHSHSSVEIIEVKAGVLSCDINGKIITVSKNETILINSNIGHRLFSENAEISYLHVDISSYKEKPHLGEYENLYAFIQYGKHTPYLIFNENCELNEILQKIRTRYNENEESTLWYLKAYIYELIAFMYSQNLISSVTSLNLQNEKIGNIVRYVDDNFKSPITLDEICNEVKYNKYALCHNFKSATGSTIFEYINFLRISYAVEKLKEKQHSILEISTECGFSSISYFNRVFKKIIGCSPSVYNKVFSD